MTRFSLSATPETSIDTLISQARELGLDAVEVPWRVLRDDDGQLEQARKSGIQTTSIDLGALVDPASLEPQLGSILDVAARLSCRRLLLTAGSPNSSSTGEIDQVFIDGLRRLADATEAHGIALVVRAAVAEETPAAPLRGSQDVRRVLAKVNRGNVSGQASYEVFSIQGEEGANSTADFVGRLGHATLGGYPDSTDYPAVTFLSDLNAYGYGDVVAVRSHDDTAHVRQAIDALGGNGNTIDQDRISAVQDYLNAESLDGVVLNASKNVLATTGYWSMNGTCVAFIPQVGEPHLFVPAGEETWASRSGWPNIHVYQAGRIVDPAFTDSIRDGLARVAKSNHISHGTVGIEGVFRAQVPPHMAHEVSGRHEALRPVIEEVFGGTRFVTDGFTRMRAAKTDTELRAIRRSAAVANVGLKTFRDGLAAGVRDIDLATDVESSLERFGVGHDGVTRARGYAFVMSGPQTSQTHLDYEFSSTRVQRQGDSVLMEMAVVADGYWQDLSRIFVIGEASEAQRNLYEVAEASFLAAVTAAVPGATGHEVDQAARQVVADAGLEEAYPHQTGHGVGVAFHEQYPLIKPGSEHVLEEGNVIAIEPGVYIPGVGGVRNEDNLVVGSPDGATTLQTIPHAISVAN